MHPDHLVGALRRRREGADRDRGGIRREHRLRRQLGVGAAEDLLLDRRVLDDRLDHQIRGNQVADDRDPSDDVLRLRPASLSELAEAAAHRVERTVGRPRLRVVKRHAPPGCRDHLGDPPSHLPRSDNENVLELHGAGNYRS